MTWWLNWLRLRWTYQVQCRAIRWRDDFYLWLAWRLPRGLVKWAAIRLGAHATQGSWSKVNVPELLFMDALRRWDLEGRRAEVDADAHYRGVDLLKKREPLVGFPSEETPRIIFPPTGSRFQ